MGYNITNISSSRDALKLTQTLNIAVDGSFAIGILLLVYAMTFAYFIRYGGTAAHIASSFITTVVGVLMFFMKLISWQILAVPIAMFVGGIILKQFLER